MTSKTNELFAKQLQAWVWEAGVIFNFEEICSRVENQFLSNDALKSYFNEGISTKLLFGAREMQKILKRLGGENLQEPIEDLLNLTVLILRDDRFYHNQQFISNLITLHQLSVLFANVNLDFAHDDKLLLKPPYDNTQWETTKNFLHFKDDFYKEKIISNSEAVYLIKDQIKSKGENSYSFIDSCENLKEKMKKHFDDWVKQLPPPAIRNICGKNEDELKSLPNPQYKIIFKYISKGQINSENLHSILFELENNPNLYLPSPPLVCIASDTKVTCEQREVPLNQSSEAVNKVEDMDNNAKGNCVQTGLSNKRYRKEPKCNIRKKTKSSIIMLKGELWEIAHNESSSSSNEDYCNNEDIEVQDGIDIRNQTSRTDESVSSFDKKYKIKTVSENEGLSSSISFCNLDQLNKDISNLDKLIGKTRSILVELNQKSLLLRWRRCQLIWEDNNDNEELKRRSDGSKEINSQEHSTSNISTLKENKYVSLPVEEDIENIPLNSTPISSTFATNATPDDNHNNSNNNKNGSIANSSSCSMPDLTCYEDEESCNNKDIIKSSRRMYKQGKFLPASNTFSSNSDSSMPNLSMCENLPDYDLPRTERESEQRSEDIISILGNKCSCYVYLTPLRQSDLDKLNHSGSSKRSGNNNINEGNSLTKIDLIVTNSHSSPDSQAVILEPCGSHHNLKKRKYEKGNSEDSVQDKKRLRLGSASLSSSEDSSESSQNIKLKSTDSLYKESADNLEDTFESAKSKLSSPKSVHWDDDDSQISGDEPNNNKAASISNLNSLKITKVLKVSLQSDCEKFLPILKSVNNKHPKSSSPKTNLLSSLKNNSSSNHPIESLTDDTERKKCLSVSCPIPIALVTPKFKIFSDENISSICSDNDGSHSSDEDIRPSKRIILERRQNRCKKINCRESTTDNNKHPKSSSPKTNLLSSLKNNSSSNHPIESLTDDTERKKCQSVSSPIPIARGKPKFKIFSDDNNPSICSDNDGSHSSDEGIRPSKRIILERNQNRSKKINYTESTTDTEIDSSSTFSLIARRKIHHKTSVLNRSKFGDLTNYIISSSESESSDEEEEEEEEENLNVKKKKKSLQEK